MSRELIFATEARLHRTPSGAFHSDLAEAWYDRWHDYLGPFERVTVVARVEDGERVGGRAVEGPGVSVVPLPHYRGPLEMLLRLPGVLRQVSKIEPSDGAFYGGRYPGVVSTLVSLVARRKGFPVLVYLVGDVRDVLKSGVAGRVGRMLSSCAALVVRRQVAGANGVVYVTERTLQASYPAAANASTFVRSNVVLGADAFADHAKVFSPQDSPIQLIAVGSQEQLYKGHDVLIRALGRVRETGLNAHLNLVGEGVRQRELRSLVRSLGLEAHVTFVGHLQGPELVRTALDGADLFVMPSRTEGLPRALLEAMARGLPCAGSCVGGIPELLNDKVLAPPGDVSALADVISGLLSSPEEMNEQAQCNLLRAREVSTLLGANGLQSFLKSLVESRGRRDVP